VEIDLLFSRVIPRNRPCIWFTADFLRNCQTIPTSSNVWTFWFLYILVNTWCSQVFPLTLAIHIEGWSDIFWISFVTRDVNTPFHVIFFVTPNSLLGTKCAHDCGVQRSILCVFLSWLSVFVCEIVSLTALGLADPAGWANWTACPSNLHDCTSPSLDYMSIHVIVPRILHLGTRDSNSGPCVASTLPTEPIPTRHPPLVFSHKMSIQVFPLQRIVFLFLRLSFLSILTWSNWCVMVPFFQNLLCFFYFVNNVLKLTSDSLWMIIYSFTLLYGLRIWCKYTLPNTKSQMFSPIVYSFRLYAYCLIFIWWKILTGLSLPMWVIYCTDSICWKDTLHLNLFAPLSSQFSMYVGGQPYCTDPLVCQVLHSWRVWLWESWH
jgi:hypothetical protein